MIDSFAFWNLYREHFFYFMRNNVYSERWIFPYRNYSRLIIIKKELKKNGIIRLFGIYYSVEKHCLIASWKKNRKCSDKLPLVLL